MSDTVLDAPLTRLRALLAGDLEAVEVKMAREMSSDKAALVGRVSGHLIGAGGKRLRPVLTLGAARLFGGGGEAAVALAAAVEFIHNATLLHDDVIDESARRRGKPTANDMFGNKPSVLVGDFLFARSFQMMVETGSLEILRILSDAAAVIVEGEVLQLSAANSLVGGEAVYLQIVRGKTAALFEAACRAGALSAGASVEQAAELAAYGDALGVAFQIADDLLDYAGDSATIGKDPGDDFREGKATLPVLLAHEAGDEAERGFWARVIEARDQHVGDFEEALEIMARHDALSRAAARAREEAARARAALMAAPASPLRDDMAALADYVVRRAA